MTEARKFVVGYFRYLKKWNDSASLIHMIESVNRMVEIGEDVSDSVMIELDSAANFECNDARVSTGDLSIMSLSDFYQVLLRDVRDKKIDKILK